MTRKRAANADHHHDPARRRLLLQAGVVLPGVLVSPWDALAAMNRPRRVDFHHTHTNEKLSVVYFAEGRYLKSPLAQINHFLRDFRSGEVHRIDRHLLDLLHLVRATGGSAGTFEVISGYRSPATNRTLRKAGNGVAKRSLHMQGKAIDVRLTSLDSARLRDLAKKLKLGGVGYYRKSDFVHLDTGRFRTW